MGIKRGAGVLLVVREKETTSDLILTDLDTENLNKQKNLPEKYKAEEAGCDTVGATNRRKKEATGVALVATAEGGGRRSCWARRRSELGWSKEDGALGIAGGCLAKKKIVGGSGFLNPFSCESFRENAPAPPQLFGFLHNWTLTPQTNQLFN